MFRLDEDLSASTSSCARTNCRGAPRRRAHAARADGVRGRRQDDLHDEHCVVGTRKMTAALVDNLGVEAPGGGRTFPTPEAMAEADEAFYKEVVRAGYRGRTSRARDRRRRRNASTSRS